jgi:hypothetical protein
MALSSQLSMLEFSASSKHSLPLLKLEAESWKDFLITF